MIEKKIDKLIEKSDKINNKKVDWTKAWGKKYPVLLNYQEKVDVTFYKKEIRKLLNKLEEEYSYNKEDAMLVLKDMLAHEYMEKNEE